MNWREDRKSSTPEAWGRTLFFSLFIYGRFPVLLFSTFFSILFFSCLLFLTDARPWTEPI